MVWRVSQLSLGNFGDLQRRAGGERVGGEDNEDWRKQKGLTTCSSIYGDAMARRCSGQSSSGFRVQRREGRERGGRGEGGEEGEVHIGVPLR